MSVFLASFSGLYFTVYAITDEVYRREFFTVIMNELAPCGRGASDLPRAAARGR